MYIFMNDISRNIIRDRSSVVMPNEVSDRARKTR